MEPFFLYLIQVSIALAVFYILYSLVLKRDTFLRLRRFFFLSVIAFSLVYPLFTIPALSDAWSFSTTGLLESEEVVSVTIGDPGVAVLHDGEMGTNTPVPWSKVMGILYVGVTLIFFIRFITQLFSIYRVQSKSEKQTVQNVPVYVLKENMTPFSFFNLIFVHADRHSENELDQILLHEQTHVKQWHSIDIVLIELLCIFLWWNPFVWLLKREITMNLEYLADEEVLREGVNCQEYQYHLLRLTYHETAVPIVNNFNVSRLKQRVMMMNQSKSPASRVVKYLSVLPLFFLLITANSVYGAQDDQFLPEPPPEKVLDEVFVAVEKQPEFPGGEKALMKFLADNIRYPVIAQENGIQGRVICSLVIAKDGSVTNVSVQRGVDPSLDAEVVRLINSMPKWNPGTQRGNAVNVRAIMPVVFRLQGDVPQDPLLSKEDREALAVREMNAVGAVDGMLIFDEIVVVGYTSQSSKGPVAPNPPQKKETVREEVFVVVEEQPTFPGGNKGMMEFLGENVKYPVEAQSNGIQGRVILNFVVMKDGSLTDINVVRGVDPLLDAEAVRVIGEMPKWIPGKQRGQAVNVKFTLPITFSLTKSDPFE